MVLTEMGSGFSGVISSVDGDERFLRRALSMGLIQGADITIMRNQRRQPLLVLSMDTVIAINRDDASNISVEAE